MNILKEPAHVAKEIYDCCDTVAQCWQLFGQWATKYDTMPSAYINAIASELHLILFK